MTEARRFIGTLVNDRLPRFFMGRLYPLVVGAIVTLGYCFGIEFYLNIVNVLLVSLGLAVCKSARPAIMFIISFVFQVSVKNSPGVPNFSDYYFTSWRLPTVFVLGAVLLLSVMYFSAKNKIFSGISIKNTPLLLPLLILSLAFAVNGLFSDKWQLADLVYGLCNGACLTLVFLFFYFGLRRDDKRELTSYFVYVSAVLAVILLIELAQCYIANGIPFDPFTLDIDVFAKEKLHFGWGISNTMGVSLIVLIPACFLGFYEKRGRFVYIPLAFAVYFAAFATMSRNAILFGTLTLVLCIAVLIFSSRHKKLYGIIAAAFLAICAVLAIVYRELLYEGLSGYFTDNGRFSLWEQGIDNFLSSPVFGVGFFNFGVEIFETAEFLPTMAHQTFVQLLSAMGIFGLLAYLFYRAATVIPLVRRPSATKTLIALSAAAMLLESLVDNFVFYFLPTLHYSVALAILFAVYEGEMEGLTKQT